MNKPQITAALAEIGAAWAVRAGKFLDPADDFDAEPSYHVHPDVANPQQGDILRFESLADISEWIMARRAALANPEQAMEIMEDWRNGR